jgi:hypothetical protein
MLAHTRAPPPPSKDPIEIILNNEARRERSYINRLPQDLVTYMLPFWHAAAIPSVRWPDERTPPFSPMAATLREHAHLKLSVKSFEMEARMHLSSYGETHEWDHARGAYTRTKQGPCFPCWAFVDTDGNHCMRVFVFSTADVQHINSALFGAHLKDSSLYGRLRAESYVNNIGHLWVVLRLDMGLRGKHLVFRV